MLKVSGKVAKLKFNVRGYITSAIKVSEEEQKRAITAWVKAVASSIPVYTGTAIGTIAPVGRTVGYILAPIGRNTTKKYFYHNGKRYPLGFGVGESYQEHVLDTKMSGNIITSTFIFNENLPYVVWNSLYNTPIPKSKTPWFALQKGVAAYVQYIRDNLPERLPKHSKFLRIKIVKVV